MHIPMADNEQAIASWMQEAEAETGHLVKAGVPAAKAVSQAHEAVTRRHKAAEVPDPLALHR